MAEEFSGKSKKKLPESVSLQQKADKDHFDFMYPKFVSDYKKGKCVLCGKPFTTISKDTPCLHWLLRQCKFKTKDFPSIYQNFSYLNISSYLRMVANEEKKQININNMDHLKSSKNLFEYSVRWKNIEWTFHCSEKDFSGHGGKGSEHPHYHFQMRIDGRQFINFNSFHVPFSNEDIFKLKLTVDYPDEYFIDYFDEGAGMQEALEVDPESIVSNTRISTNEEEEDDAIYNIVTVIGGDGEKVDMNTFIAMHEEKARTGESTAILAKKHFPNDSHSHDKARR